MHRTPRLPVTSWWKNFDFLIKEVYRFHEFIFFFIDLIHSALNQTFKDESSFQWTDDHIVNRQTYLVLSCHDTADVCIMLDYRKHKQMITPYVTSNDCFFKLYHSTSSITISYGRKKGRQYKAWDNGPGPHERKERRGLNRMLLHSHPIATVSLIIHTHEMGSTIYS